MIGYPSTCVHELVLPDGGEMVPQDRVDLLAEALERWLANPQRLMAARESARRQAELFDIRQIALQLWDEYQSLRN
jgi:glycosyltransferase involved in cell wall biosynthesis